MGWPARFLAVFVVALVAVLVGTTEVEVDEVVVASDCCGSELLTRGAATLSAETLGTKRVKDLRRLLNERGVDCVGCTEKHEFVTRVLETQELPSVRDEAGVLRNLTYAVSSGRQSEQMVRIPGGSFSMGLKHQVIPGDGEAPQRHVTLSPFWLDVAEVTNAQFAEFVTETSFVTDSERFGWSFVFDLAVDPGVAAGITQAVAGAEWWLPVNGSTWREPEGPGTDVFATRRADHAVVQVSWADAVAYCSWRRARLPTEAEWEFAARGGEKGHLFPWGSQLTPNGEHRANIWQGSFPKRNAAEDGHLWTCPTDAYPPQNQYGLKNMIGNVWEWVEDWWTVEHDPSAHLVNPRGPPTGTEKTKKGGSFLCHKSFCYRYRSAARHKNTPDSATLNNGFRCARDVDVASAA